MVVSRFGSDRQFMEKVSYKTQTAFGKNPEKAVMGDYPTLNDINAAYGKGFAVEWLISHVTNLSLYTNAKNMDVNQIAEVSDVLAAEYKHLKITELLLFFFWFKSGRYGRFYGSVDPMVITCAMKDFVEERNAIIDRCEQKRREAEAEKGKVGAVSYEEWKKEKETTNNSLSL